MSIARTDRNMTAAPSQAFETANSGTVAVGVAVVVIGRNEGERLMACLASLNSLGVVVVYVDSGSSDGSAQKAKPLCTYVHELDPARPFSAARARNEGFAAVLDRQPQTQYVQFIDGDCTLLPGWITSAAQAMEADTTRAVVIGPLQERNPNASVYNRLCSLEWKSPPGDLQNFGNLGGIMLVRAAVFSALKGFNENVIAGEDSEFGVRVGAAGSKITKIATPMATHDADIHRFGQWWTRAVRSGHAIGQRFNLNGLGAARDCAKERRSVMAWGLGLPAVILVLAWPTRGLSLLLCVGYWVLAQRVARYRLAQGDSPADAQLYARFTTLGKIAEGIGLLKFQFNKLFGRYKIIEYK
jgi:GT2 family glycosyltransferase